MTSNDYPPRRVIARLDVKGPNVIKGVHLEGLRVVGNPGELARQYYADGADEILYMDVVASLYGRNNLLDIVESTARDVFIPMVVGGGIRVIDDITAALRCGADKVAINTAAIQRPSFIDEAAHAFGSQCIVLSVEAKRRENGVWEALTDNGREKSGRNVIDWIVEAQERGAGEILVTSVDQEGTRKGFDVELMSAVRQRVRIPVIACGGCGDVSHVRELVDNDAADAICCASLFHYGIKPIPAFKAELRESGIGVRL